MSDRPPRPRGTQEGVGDDETMANELRPNDLVGSLPLVSIACGKTPSGTGFYLMRMVRAKGPKDAATAVFQRRWVEGPQTTEEALTILLQALRWYFENEGIPLP